MDLKTCNTRTLLKMLKIARKSPVSTYRVGDYYQDGDPTIADLKAELATREHIPNKDERKKNRQEEAKARKNR